MYLLCNRVLCARFYDGFFDGMTLNPFAAFGDWASESFGKVFTEGFNFRYLSGPFKGRSCACYCNNSTCFLYGRYVDTLGTLYGACSRGFT